MRIFQKNIFLILLSILSLSFSAIAQTTLKGIVLDQITGEPLAGAEIKLEGSSYKAWVKLDGTYKIENIASGTYTIQITCRNYSPYQNVTQINNTQQVLDFKLEPLSKSLTEVKVAANELKNNTNNIEKKSDAIINVLNAKTIQLLPDITVANILQRVSGVTIEKSSSGEARYPIIRGMEKRYINTLINGVKISSPDNKSRFIPLDLFPSELLERLEVSKSLTPSMEGDAIGGTINLVMKDAPNKLFVQTNTALGYSNFFMHNTYSQFDNSTMNVNSPTQLNNRNYTAVPTDFTNKHLNYTNLKTPVNSALGVTIGNRFGAKKQFGYIVSGSFQNTYKGTSSTFLLPNAQPGVYNLPQFVELQNRIYSSESKRIGVNAKLDYKINEKNKISLVTTYVRLDDYQTRLILDTIALNSLVDNFSRSTWQYQSIFNANLQGKHQLRYQYQLDWNLVYSNALNHIPDQTEFMHEYPVSTHSPDILNSLTHRWTSNNDKDFTVYLNVTKHKNLFNRDIEWKAGFMNRTKNRSNFYNTYSLKPKLPSGSSFQNYTTIDQAVFLFNPVSAGLPELNGNNYTFDEQITAAYLQAKLMINSKLELITGARMENTYQHYNTELPPTAAARNGTLKYNDILPSAQFKYTLAANKFLRLAYYSAIARPSFAELIPDGPQGELFKEQGNPQKLRHTTSNNLDLRYEHYINPSSQLLVGTFYKRIVDPIEYTAVKTGVTSQTLIPTNIGTATNYGLELVYQKFFGKIGFNVNYTYTQSSITNDSMLYVDKINGLITTRYKSETRPLQGQSNHIGNVSLIFKDAKLGLDAQLAFVYTGARISLVSPYYGLHYWQSPMQQLDFSVEKRINKKWFVYAKIINITNTPLQLELKQPYNDYIKASGSRSLPIQDDADNKIIVQRDYYKTSFLFGIRYKF
jgi:outer membrane receptor protein involved in Fe transport